MECILVSRKEAAQLLGISSRHLITLEEPGLLPRPRLLGRRKLFSTREMKEWSRLGCPSAERFKLMQEGR